MIIHTQLIQCGVGNPRHIKSSRRVIDNTLSARLHATLLILNTCNLRSNNQSLGIHDTKRGFHVTLVSDFLISCLQFLRFHQYSCFRIPRYFATTVKPFVSGFHTVFSRNVLFARYNACSRIPIARNTRIRASILPYFCTVMTTTTQWEEQEWDT